MRLGGRVPFTDVALIDPAEEINELRGTLNSIQDVLDLDAMRKQIEELEDQAAAPDLWNDQDRAQKVTSKLSYLQGEVNRVESLGRRLEDAAVLYELAAAEADEETREEADRELASLKSDVGALEVRTLLSGEYDAREAVVTIQSQAGGVDAADWAQMLQRMYLRWAERKGYPTDVYETSYAEEAGIKSTTFTVKAPYAYGTLRGEHGTHRLVRISPFDNQGRRQTSFAGVDVVPVVETTDHIDINEDDLRVDVYRSSGPGGQGVNTTDSAVRLTHLPTGIVVSCQNERSQLQNKATAMAVLQSKLLERKRQEETAALNEIRGESTTSWGTQIRNYVLHPYQIVKDLRTGAEAGNPSTVLDGDIDGFIEAEIRWTRRQESGADDA
jgi:peptide chain release factor 2